MKAKVILVVVGVVVLVVLVRFARIWFMDPSHTSVPLRPPAAVIQKEADELRAAVAALDAQAREAATALTREALADGYLSIQEEREVPQKAAAEAEAIKARAPFPAVIEGFTFTGRDGAEVKVAGFRFDAKVAEDILENEFNKRRTAVRERELLDRLRSLLRTNTQDDQWLDDKEQETVLRFIVTPEPRKDAGLKRPVALAAIDSFCKEHRIGRGLKPDAPRR
jgi:hypothetical protein